MKKIEFRIFYKLFFYSIAIVFLTIVSTYVFNILFLDNFYVYKVKKQIPKIERKLEYFEKTGNIDALKKYSQHLHEKDGIIVLVLNKENCQWEGYRVTFKDHIPVENLNNKIFVIKENPENGSKTLVYDTHIEDNWFSIRTSLSTISNYKREIYEFNVLVSIFIVLLLSIIGLYTSRYFLKDIRNITEATKKISNLDFVENLNITRNDEIGDLARNVETMSRELKIAIDNIQSFVSNASHELKTPVAIILSNTELLLDKDASKDEVYKIAKIILKETKEMKDLINNLLVLSKTNSKNFKLNCKSFSLKNLVENSLEKYDFLEFSKNLEIDENIQDLNLTGDKNLLGIVIDNIILNSFKYSPEDSQINIYTENGKFYVENPVLEEKNVNLENIWKPFVRCGNSQNIDGTGLGLSIVKNILELHQLKYGIILENNLFKFYIDFKK